MASQKYGAIIGYDVWWFHNLWTGGVEGIQRCDLLVSPEARKIAAVVTADSRSWKPLEEKVKAAGLSILVAKSHQEAGRKAKTLLGH